MNKRPQRIRIKNELGKLQSLPDGPTQYERLPGGSEVVILGVGPDPSELALLAGSGKAVYVIEAPEYKGQMPPQWQAALPSHWKSIDPEDLDDDLLARAKIIIYLPAVRMFPTFWGRITGRCRWLKATSGVTPRPARTVILPTTQADLLHNELETALTGAGFEVLRLTPKAVGAELPAILRKQQPALFLSVNFRGLDPHGEVYHLLEAAGVTVCVWCVDNPFHLISGLRSPFWKQTHLAVTDSWFIDPLARHGAQKLWHMPLATTPSLFASPRQGNEDLSQRIVFVGRSQFPWKNSFFAGCKVPRWQWETAEKLLRDGGRPDYAWWLERLDIWPLWPDKDSRRVGLGAEDASRERRLACIESAAALPMTVIGDSDWADLLPASAELRPPVDYYGELPGIYAGAGWNLNVTSLLLPSGLTQRHFDVWAAGGLLLSDDTPGLSLFPEELTHEISFARPVDIPKLAKRLAPGTALREELIQAWRDEILTNHTYEVRTAALLDWLDT
ncbi:glycosyltransferase family protein [Desulfovibrio ferrophilus]|uniref:Spore protein YkvP/CgeB glycosyl transferase-like domain-containing protein n=1 Tax=Desulfovibrio ferrophilus TaxID=241368 RepID=A0A2Z6AUQ5_9BACT|nr:DUF3880 domain-containing protein [Desulfovibrio ferrophilus]BBD06958.1 uncharacterized protein DFE_0232 [Desulfovibrio ferrophilus]